MTRSSSVRWRGNWTQARDGAKRHGCVSRSTFDARKLANLGEAEKIGHDGLAAAVLVGAVGMQAIAAAAGFRDRPAASDRSLLPRNQANARGRDRLPFGVAVGAPGREAGRDRRRGLQRLLIERARRLALVAEAVGADGPEKTRPASFAAS